MTEDEDFDEGDDMEATATLANTGGRVRFTADMAVRYLQLDGTITNGVYQIAEGRSDRKGFITLKERDGTQTVRVHHRRVLPLSVDGRAVVIESGDKFWALCPDCGQVVGVEVSTESIACQKCSKTFPLHWLGVKPMADTTTEKTKKEPKVKVPKPEKAPKAVKEKPARPEKVVKTPTPVDITAIAKTPNCELWTKKNVKFDHARVDVQAHTLLFVGAAPRKMCFNTYNGTMGKKDIALPIAEFVADKAAKGAKAAWFAVPDLEKARAKLQKEGYERQ